MCCKSFLPKETVSRDFGPLFLKKKTQTGLHMKKQNYSTKYLVFAKIFEKNADVSTINDEQQFGK